MTRTLAQRLWTSIYVVFIILLCFEEIFDNTIFPLTSIKYPVFLALLCRVVILKKKIFYKVPLLIRIYYFVLLLYLIVSIPDFIQINFEGLKVWKQYLWLPFLFLLFSNATMITGESISYYLRVFVNCVIVYSFLNFLLYFIPLPIWDESEWYWGRISVGYPTIDVVIMAFALILLFFYEYLFFSFFRRFVYVIILIFSIISQASGTGIVLLLIITIMNIINHVYHLRVSSKKTTYQKTSKLFLSSLFSIIFLSSFMYGYLKTTQPELVDMLEKTIENRYFVLIGQEEESSQGINTLDARKDWFSDAENKLLRNDVWRVFWGCGYGVISSSSHSDNRQFRLEDQFYSNLLSMGWFGASLYIILLGDLIMISFKNRKKEYNIYVYGASALITLISSFTSVCLGAVGISLALSLLSVDACYYNDIGVISRK